MKFLCLLAVPGALATMHWIDVGHTCSNVNCSCLPNVCVNHGSLNNSSNRISLAIPHCARNSCYPVRLTCSVNGSIFVKQLNASDSLRLSLFIYCSPDLDWSDDFITLPPTIVAPSPPPTIVAPSTPPTIVAPSPPPTILTPSPPPTILAPMPPPTILAPMPSPTCQSDPLCKNCLAQNNPVYFQKGVLNVCGKCLSVSRELRPACFNCLSWARPGNGDGEYCTRCSSDELFHQECFDCTVNLDGYCTRERSCFNPPNSTADGAAFTATIEERRACWDCMAKHRVYKWGKLSCGGMVKYGGR
jgi:hypothetical protein